MNTATHATAPQGAQHPELESLLAQVEAALAALGDALRLRDSAAIDVQAQNLQRALEQTVNAFARAARAIGGVPAPLRARLVQASGQVAAQRESLMRATVALDRAIDTLMPQDSSSASTNVYGQRGWSGTSAYRS